MGAAWTVVGVVGGSGAAVLLGLLLFRFRVRFDAGDGRRLLRWGIGPFGASVDFSESPVRLRVLGRSVRVLRPGMLRPGLELLPALVPPLFRFALDLWRDTTVERLEGEVRGGFRDPAATGMAFGWFQAVRGAVPLVGRRLRFRPEWDEGGWRARVTVSLAAPAWKVAWSGARLLPRLPLRRLLGLWRLGRQDGNR